MFGWLPTDPPQEQRRSVPTLTYCHRKQLSIEFGVGRDNLTSSHSLRRFSYFRGIG